MTKSDYALSQLNEMIANTKGTSNVRLERACFGFAAQCQDRFPKRAAEFVRMLERLVKA